MIATAYNGSSLITGYICYEYVISILDLICLNSLDSNHLNMCSCSNINISIETNCNLAFYIYIYILCILILRCHFNLVHDMHVV